ncbi:hypothetical protein Sta7437_0449 [Stanieria cyanosphaera PCC 7437]|uniref:Uncharacterized protein n=1 Tax=Stanieria cyanosphaera (strain ATCC 29371 / PCC 7437) TaxID=111780 RepID=K9XNH1_STAC7|nr:hypothetical protein [Stanieria cyanosphaera]AFZ34058.1 hypothetical protein Sta7437_0449 [Stanieria cyanosphaera PCC 7437]
MNKKLLKVNQLFLAGLLGLILSITTTKLSSMFNLSLVRADNIQNDTNNINEFNLIELGVPPFRQDAPKNNPNRSSSIELQLISTTPNQITDTEAWFERNNLSLPTYQVPNFNLNQLGDLPDYLPRSFGDNILVKAIHYRDRDFLIYGNDYGDGRYLFSYDSDSHQFTAGYDFSNYSLSPDYVESDLDFVNQSLTWVNQEDNILYVSHRHNTYAQSSLGMNGYLTAINTDNNQIIWRSQPLVCNAGNFEIINEVIICGYGFTAEPDFLYLIDKNNGKVLQQINLKTAPDYIIRKGNKLYVRTYDTDYIFEIKFMNKM